MISIRILLSGLPTRIPRAELQSTHKTACRRERGLHRVRVRHTLSNRTKFVVSRCSSQPAARQSGQSEHALHAVNRSSTRAATSSQNVLRLVDLQAIAQARGMHLGLRNLGPVYRIVCRDGGATGPILATTSGFVLPPLKLMHCDSMQVFTPRLAEADRERIRGGSFFGLSLLIVAAIMSHGFECGCVKAEMLAINDDDHQHARLVKYYKRMGFEKVLEVGNNGLSDLPHLLVWGGAGTRMNCDPEQFLRRWTPLLQRSSQ